MATKRIVPWVEETSRIITFADGDRSLESWEMTHATDEAALKLTKKTLKQLTYLEWCEAVASSMALTDYLSSQKLNSKRQLARLAN